MVRSIYMQEGIIRVAQNAIKEGFNNDIIIKLTGLSNEEIENLRKEE